jgi:hypothetical protein
MRPFVMAPVIAPVASTAAPKDVAPADIVRASVLGVDLVGAPQ